MRAVVLQLHSNMRRMILVLAAQAGLVLAFTMLSPSQDLVLFLALGMVVALYLFAIAVAFRVQNDRFLYLAVAFASAPVIILVFGALGILLSMLIGTFEFPRQD